MRIFGGLVYMYVNVAEYTGLICAEFAYTLVCFDIAATLLS